MASNVPDQLLKSVVDYFRPRQVILFGSAARGTSGPDSDLDLLVLLDDDAPQSLLSWRARYEARRNYHGAVDVIPCRVSAFRRRADVAGTLAHTVSTEGVTVYQRA